jgi:hypothetical protein
VRLDGRAGTHVRVFADDKPIGAFDLGDDEDWTERTFDIPSRDIHLGIGGERATVELRVENGSVTVYHYWFVV